MKHTRLATVVLTAGAALTAGSALGASPATASPVVPGITPVGGTSTECSGTKTGSVHDTLVVHPGHTCILDNAQVPSEVKVYGDTSDGSNPATLIVRNHSTVTSVTAYGNGNTSATKVGADVTVQQSKIGEQLNLRDNARYRLSDSTIGLTLNTVKGVTGEYYPHGTVSGTTLDAIDNQGQLILQDGTTVNSALDSSWGTVKMSGTTVPGSVDLKGLQRAQICGSHIGTLNIGGPSMYIGDNGLCKGNEIDHNLTVRSDSADKGLLKSFWNNTVHGKTSSPTSDKVTLRSGGNNVFEGGVTGVLASAAK